MKNRPPKADEIEITVIGPDTGFGECVLVHVGNGDWIVFDCCLNSKTQIPFPLEYLNSLYGTGSEKYKITHIVLTHWHHDHVRGATRLYSASPDATLCFSNLLQSEEVSKILALSKTKKNSRFREIETLYSVYIDRLASNPRADFRFLKKRCPLLEHPEGGIKIDVISPSDHAVFQNHLKLKELEMNVAGKAIDEEILIEDIGPNDCSVAVVIRLKNQQIILGADLEFHGNKQMGWHDVIKSKLIDIRPVNIYKVAHHGSETAYRKGMWKQLNIQDGCFAILTPWRFGSNFIPNIQMIDVILEHTKKAYITCDPFNVSKDDIMGTGVNTSLARTEWGIVTLRKSITDDDTWRINISGSAIKLSDLKTS